MDASHEWQPSGLVTWTTDFGLENGFVGTMRGVLLARAPQATWVDLTHGIPAQALDVAAIELRSALPY
ncbi:MAG TPA: SAM-dependent chlorinase/fluorinase, partial [Planctomycetota bacterium]|nr:SAM-dependent chlorinase/fluorinase [Planctomycetota bacterium]